MSVFTDLISAQPRALLGLWQALATPYTAEICSQAGFDWLLFDGEHAPNTSQTLLAQLHAVSSSGVHAIARPPAADPAIIKQYLDIGFQTLLIPMIDSAEQAAAAVAATRFPPHGVRGVASATSRASGFGTQAGYLAQAHEKVGVIVQIESRSALEQIDAIAATTGVDAMFIGPADLAASLGQLGDPRASIVQENIDTAFASIKRSNKPVGIFALDPQDARRRISQGFDFISVGTDIGLLVHGANNILRACGHAEE